MLSQEKSQKLETVLLHDETILKETLSKLFTKQESIPTFDTEIHSILGYGGKGVYTDEILSLWFHEEASDDFLKHCEPHIEQLFVTIGTNGGPHALLQKRKLGMSKDFIIQEILKESLPQHKLLTLLIDLFVLDEESIKQEGFMDDNFIKTHPEYIPFYIGRIGAKNINQLKHLLEIFNTQSLEDFVIDYKLKNYFLTTIYTLFKKFDEVDSSTQEEILKLTNKKSLKGMADYIKEEDFHEKIL